MDPTDPSKGSRFGAWNESLKAGAHRLAPSPGGQLHARQAARKDQIGGPVAAARRTHRARLLALKRVRRPTPAPAASASATPAASAARTTPGLVQLGFPVVSPVVSPVELAAIARMPAVMPVVLAFRSGGTGGGGAGDTAGGRTLREALTELGELLAAGPAAVEVRVL